ncbi:Putative hypothetical protein [Helicobacter mustelae 12198]|uniref:Uncharacterized protein n=1 Tax=Helicobacter mustelae (strain ATCC 43772 / CCUG 25715 / CIP 103759 / LMG 18044 / NCTC 12198 / R85-136P) TaxID=679897 RepID=D3UH08_HELM1|nr:Putative hypothetical protein [Helicobacter mustelae 12198]
MAGFVWLFLTRFTWPGLGFLAWFGTPSLHEGYDTSFFPCQHQPHPYASSLSCVPPAAMPSPCMPRLTSPAYTPYTSLKYPHVSKSLAPHLLALDSLYCFSKFPLAQKTQKIDSFLKIMTYTLIKVYSNYINFMIIYQFML